jgi:hypothetical protein
MERDEVEEVLNIRGMKNKQAMVTGHPELGDILLEAKLEKEEDGEEEEEEEKDLNLTYVHTLYEYAWAKYKFLQ